MPMLCPGLKEECLHQPNGCPSSCARDFHRLTKTAHLADVTHTSQAPPAMVRAALLVLLGHVEPGWDNCKWIVTEWLEGRLNAAPQAATGTVPPESSAPAVAAPQPSTKLDTSPQVSHTTHDWQPVGGVLRFESHPGGESPHVHTTCAKCGARAWFLEYQWELLTKVCA